MQNCTTILGIIDMRQRGISYDACRSRYKVGCSTITLIMNRFKDSGKDLDTLKQMPTEEVEHLFFPPENLRRKEDCVMPDYQAVYDFSSIFTQFTYETSRNVFQCVKQLKPVCLALLHK